MLCDKWVKRYPLNNKECKNCPAIGVCGGGCIFNAEVNYGDINMRDKAFCIHTNKILNWMLINSIKEKLKTD